MMMADIDAQEDEMDVQLPSVGDFSFDGILKAVEPQGTATTFFSLLCMVMLTRI